MAAPLVVSPGEVTILACSTGVVSTTGGVSPRESVGKCVNVKVGTV